MTLILGELSSFGIAMAADSAVTFKNIGTGLSFARPNAAKKLQFIPYLNAGISCWGLGKIGAEATDEWLDKFINKNSFKTLQEFAEGLAKQLNSLIKDPNIGNGIAGFHLAGFENYNGIPTPSFYHVHDGVSQVLQKRGISINTKQFNANHDVPPDIFIKNYSGGWYLTRNGDIQIYTEMFDSLKDYFDSLKASRGIVIPNSQNLQERVEYLIFQIRTIAEIYRFSNLVRGIGGGIHYLTINPSGLKSQGVFY